MVSHYEYVPRQLDAALNCVEVKCLLHHLPEDQVPVQLLHWAPEAPYVLTSPTLYRRGVRARVILRLPGERSLHLLGMLGVREDALRVEHPLVGRRV